MNLPGHPPKPKTEPEAPRKREFLISFRNGITRTIQSNDLIFTDHHIVFREGRAETNDLFLVEAVNAAEVIYVKEVEDLL